MSLSNEKPKPIHVLSFDSLLAISSKFNRFSFIESFLYLMRMLHLDASLGFDLSMQSDGVAKQPYDFSQSLASLIQIEFIYSFQFDFLYKKYKRIIITNKLVPSDLVVVVGAVVIVV